MTKDIEEIMQDFEDKFIHSLSDVNMLRNWLRTTLTTLTKHHEAEVQKAYERGVADGTGKPLLAIENVREAEQVKCTRQLKEWIENNTPK